MSVLLHCTLVHTIQSEALCVWLHICNGTSLSSLQKCHAMMVMVRAESNEGIDLHSAVSAWHFNQSLEQLTSPFPPPPLSSRLTSSLFFLPFDLLTLKFTQPQSFHRTWIAVSPRLPLLWSFLYLLLLSGWVSLKPKRSRSLCSHGSASISLLVNTWTAQDQYLINK